MEDLIKYAQTVINKHPQLKEEIEELVQLCKDEIEEGGSPDHEIQLCRGSIEELISDIPEVN